MELATICYTESQKGMHNMDGQVADLYHLPDMEQYADLHLLALRLMHGTPCSLVYYMVCHAPPLARWMQNTTISDLLTMARFRV